VDKLLPGFSSPGNTYVADFCSSAQCTVSQYREKYLKKDSGAIQDILIILVSSMGGYGLISIAAGSYLAALGSVIMTALIIKVSGVALLEKSLKEQKSNTLNIQNGPVPLFHGSQKDNYHYFRKSLVI